MENPFESGQRKVIPAVLVYAQRSRDGVRECLMVSRQGKPGDFHGGKWNGLGGKLEAGESMVEAASRELKEESGLNLSHERFAVLGTLQFPLFKPHKNEDWLVFVLTVELRDGEIPWPAGPEGALQFIPWDRIPGLNLWEGDRHFISLVREATPFAGCIWYEQGRVVRHWMQRMQTLTHLHA